MIHIIISYISALFNLDLFQEFPVEVINWSLTAQKNTAKTGNFFTLVTSISYIHLEIKGHFYYNTILLFKRRQRIYVPEDATGTIY